LPTRAYEKRKMKGLNLRTLLRMSTAFKAAPLSLWQSSKVLPVEFESTNYRS